MAGAIPQPASSQRGKPQRDTPRAENARDARATLFFCETPNVQCRTDLNQFDLDGIRDLFVFSAWRQIRGEHSQQLRLLLPNGDLYQMVETRFTTDAVASSPQVQVAARSRNEPTVIVPVAVAGTHITQRSLAGTWTVELFLDGKFVLRRELVLRPRGQQ